MLQKAHPNRANRQDRGRRVAELAAAGLLAATAAQGQNPVKLAAAARFDISASASVGAIREGTVLAGNGSLGRMNWIPEEERPRSYTCEFSVIHFGWTEIAVRFVPDGSGTLTLSLMGPWEPSEAPGNPIYRQEVLWDALTAEGTTLTNGSFEDLAGSLPASWSRPYGDASVVSVGVTPVDGENLVRTWHDGSLRQTVPVTRGQPVTLRFFARARVPEGFIDNPRISDPSSAAHRARIQFMRGTNLGNSLEAPAGQDWGQTYTEADFVQIRAEGFDHVRIPARWNDHAGPAPDFAIDETFARKVDALLDWAQAHGLGAIVNIHHFDAFTDDPASQADKFYRLWDQIAERYRNRRGSVAFELLNEPKDAATTEMMNPIYAEAIRRIRISNPDRTLFVGPGRFNQIGELPLLRLPADDDNLIVTVHSYDPFLFTHQGAGWTGDATATTGVVYPGPPPQPQQPSPPADGESWVVDWFARYSTLPTDVNPSSKGAFVGNLELARTWSDYYGRPVHVGEFGCYERADAASRAAFYFDMRETMDRLGLGWAMWDWKAGFKYWDENRDRPATHLPDALFPPVVMSDLDGPGRFRIEAAVGKRILVRRTQSLDTPPSLGDILLQVIQMEPVSEFVDPAPPQKQGFYAVEWLP